MAARKLKVSTTGYKENSKDKNLDQLYVPSPNLTMTGVKKHVKATPVYNNGSYGTPITMIPGVPSYTFPGAVGVIEEKLPKAQSIGEILYVNSKDDPAYTAYNDSLGLYNKSTAPRLTGKKSFGQYGSYGLRGRNVTDVPLPEGYTVPGPIQPIGQRITRGYYPEYLIMSYPPKPAGKDYRKKTHDIYKEPTRPVVVGQPPAGTQPQKQTPQPPVKPNYNRPNFDIKPTGDAAIDRLNQKLYGPDGLFKLANGGDISVPDLRRVTINALPKAQTFGEFVPAQQKMYDDRYVLYREQGDTPREANDLALTDARYYNQGPILNFQQFLPNPDSGVIIPAGARFPLEHIDWSTYDPWQQAMSDPEFVKRYNTLSPYEQERAKDYITSQSAENYSKSVTDVKKWEKDWYSKRAKLAQFTDLANQRLSLVESINMQPFGDSQEFYDQTPGAAAAFYPEQNYIGIPSESFEDASTILHERSHWYDQNAPQNDDMNNKAYIFRGKSYPVYNTDDPILNDILPHGYKLPGGISDPLRYGENDTTKYTSETEKILANQPVSSDDLYDVRVPFKGQKKIDDGRTYQQYYNNPTEVRARLNEWRYQHNIDPTKEYTNEELQQIIDNDINNHKSNSLDLYKVIQGRGDLLKQLHDSYVSTGDKQDPDEMPKAKKGLRKAQRGLPDDYQDFLKYSETAPENRRPDADWQYGNPRQYDHYGMWDALGKPKNFEEALANYPQWQPDPDDGYYHGFSANPNTGVWLKSHIPGEYEPGNTAWMENLAFALSNDSNWGPKNQNLIYDRELERMRYVDRKKQGGEVKPRDHKSLDNYFEAAWANSRKTN